MTTVVHTPGELFTAILAAARDSGASDVHLIAGLPPAFRVSGEILMASECEPLEREELVELTRHLLTETQLELLEERREISVSYFEPERGRIRLSLYHRVGCPEMSIRMGNLEIPSVEELMLPSVVEELSRCTSGLILITGPTGMGKTTTMNFMLDLINSSRRGKIVTIEDPVEYEHSHRMCIVTQIEVGTDTLSFASCLRSVLRLDPDVIAVGEMRDLDTIETALTAAETGHLVLATLHTPNAVTTMERITGCFDGDRQNQVILQLASTIRGIIAQRLIPTVDKSRRVLATEVVLGNTAVRTIIRENRVHQLYNAVTSSRKDGMHTLEDSLASLYQQGLISVDQAMVNSVRPDIIRDLIHR